MELQFCLLDLYLSQSLLLLLFQKLSVFNRILTILAYYPEQFNCIRHSFCNFASLKGKKNEQNCHIICDERKNTELYILPILEFHVLGRYWGDHSEGKNIRLVWSIYFCLHDLLHRKFSAMAHYFMPGLDISTSSNLSKSTKSS